MTIGILAYGSLIEKPGPELDPCIAQRIEGIKTPFPVEFARSSSTRSGAPTLIPVTTGGATVDASVLVLEETVDEEHVRDMLYRRETQKINERASYQQAQTITIHTLSPFAGLNACLYAELEANLRPLTVSWLAKLAIGSASQTAGAKKRDGISYLEAVKRRGVMTPLMPGYEAEILSQSVARDLQDAWKRARARPAKDN
jgi:hypothetical protein